MLAIQRILCPIGSSLEAKEAVPHAAFLADRHDAALHLLHVPGPYDDPHDPFPIPPDTLAAWCHAAEDVAAAAPDVSALSIVQTELDAGSPSDAIVDYAREEEIDLIVMGTRGHEGFNRILLGSVTESVARMAPCPVFTVRVGNDVTPRRTIRRVLAPMDFSAASEAGLQHAHAIARTYDAALDLLHVVDEAAFPMVYGIELAHYPGDVTDRASEQLTDLAREELGDASVKTAVTVGHPPTEILDYAATHAIDLIVLATHGRTGLDRFLMGSVAERVLRQSPVPVFIVKPESKPLTSA